MMILVLLSSVFLHLTGSVYTISEECNPIECFQAFNMLFQISDINLCEKITNLDRCIRLCSGNETETYFHQGLDDVKKDLCKRDSHELDNKCHNKHKFSFAACLYEKFHLEAKDPNTRQKVVMCNRARDATYCFKDRLPMCTDHEGDSEMLLLKLMDPMDLHNCDHTIKWPDLANFEPKASAYLNDIVNLAECFDTNSLHLTNCAHGKVIDTNSRFDSKNLCRDTKSFLNCVQKVVQGKCSSLQLLTFQEIRKPLFNYLLPRCSNEQVAALSPQFPADSDTRMKPDSDTHMKPDSVHEDASDTSLNSFHEDTSGVSDDHGLDKVAFGTSTIAPVSPTNATQVVVVHQHITYFITPKEINAANQRFVCFYLFVVVCLFCFWKEL